jgi:hypothetical protein
MQLGDIQLGEMGIRARAALAGELQDEGGQGRAKEMRRQGPSEGDERGRKVKSTRKGRRRGGGSIYAARAAGPCEDANLTERYT